MQKISQAIRQIDFFSAPATLRAQGNPQTGSILGGLISLIAVGLFAAVFFLKVQSIVQYNQISSTQTQIKLLGEQVKAYGVMFAVGVNSLNYTQSQKYFNITVRAFAISDIYTVQLAPCTSSQWQLLGNNYQSIFNQYGLSQFLCPTSTSLLNLQGTFKKTKFKKIDIVIMPCTVNDSVTCVSSSQQLAYLKAEITKQRTLTAQMYFLDQAIDASAQNPVSYFVNSDNTVSFTDRRGTDNTVQFASFSITTDQQLMPFNDYAVVTGNFVDNILNSAFQIDTLGATPYVVFQLMMNRRMISVSRTIGKIDQALSYVGGLFSIIMAFLGFFILSFNQYRYQIMVAQGSFNYNQDGKRVRLSQFHFLSYIKYSCYSWIKTLTCRSPPWQFCNQIDNTRQQITCQMDVVRLFRKIRNLQTSILYLMSQGQKMCLGLVEPPALPQVKRNRLMQEYYDAVIRGKPAVTVQDIQMTGEVVQAGFRIFMGEGNEQGQGKGVGQWEGQGNGQGNGDLGGVGMGSMENLYEMQASDNRNMDKEQVRSDGNILQIAPDRSNILQVVLHNFPHIGKQAEQVKLSPEMQQIQEQIAKAFFEMDWQIRSNIQQKIPLKIIHRLKLKYDKLNNCVPCRINLEI